MSSKMYAVIERKVVFREVPNYDKKVSVKGTNFNYKYKIKSLDIINTFPLSADYSSATTRIVTDVPIEYFSNKDAAIKYANFIKSTHFRNSTTGLRDTMDNLIQTGIAEVEQGISHNIMVKEIDVKNYYVADTRENNPIYCIADLWMDKDNKVMFPVINVWYGEITKKEKNRINLDYLKSHEEYEVFKDKIDSNYNSLTQYTIIKEKEISSLRSKAMMNYIKEKFVDMIPKFAEYINNDSNITLNGFDAEDLYLSKKFNNVDYNNNDYDSEEYEKQSKDLIQTL